MARPKKQHQAHGATEGPKSIYEIIGYKAHSYTTMNLDEYKLQLRAMNFADLHEHALSCDVIPTDNRDALTDKLVTKFLTETGPYLARGQAQSGEAQMSEEDKKKALDILSRGR